MWQRLRTWLADLPIDDPVDRRNAFFMQLFLIYIGCKMLPYKWYLLQFTSAYRAVTSGDNPAILPPFPLAIDIGTDALITVSAWLGFYLIRKGRFRQAVAQFLGTMVASSLISYACFGYAIWKVDLVAFEALALSGLMLGRKVLWSIYPMFMLSYAIGMTTDYLFNPLLLHSSHAYSALSSLILSWLLVVIILDRSSSALRNSLAESNRNRARLQREMAERERTREQLLHAQKMDAVGKLSSGVAHDFNNVLGIVLGFAQERHRLDEPGAARSEDALALARALEGVEMAARRGASVSRKLLNFSRQEVTQVETFDASRTIRELEPLLRQMLPAQVRLRIETAADALPIEFDRSQFELALLNLASNARDAMPDGGELILSATRDGPAGICIVVRDTGYGMPEGVRRRIFEPFYTTKPEGLGTGLGLAVVYGLVDRSGGRIEVDTVPGTGTTFHIRLPVAAAAAAAAEPLPSLQSRNGIRVLLVDDDDDLRHLLRTALEDGGCTVSAAATGSEARRMVAPGSLEPHVLVCDNRLPDTDGLTLMSELRRRMPRLPAILISAHLDTDGQPANQADALNERLPKPFPPSQLVARVLATARRHAEARRHAPSPEPSRQTTTST